MMNNIESRVAILAQHRPKVLRTLRVFMGHTTARAGCLGCWLCEDLTIPEALTISDQWATRADLDAHVRSSECRMLLAVIDLSETPPDISFDDLRHIGGLDVMQAVRVPPRPIPKDDRP